jgi:hypothetical protein
MNATLSGTNLIEMLVKLSVDGVNIEPIFPTYGVRTHSLIAMLIANAMRWGSRRKLFAQIADAVLKRNVFSNSYEDLTIIRDDLLGILPLLIIIGQLLFDPSSAEMISLQAIDSYCINERAVRLIGTGLKNNS